MAPRTRSVTSGPAAPGRADAGAAHAGPRGPQPASHVLTSTRRTEGGRQKDVRIAVACGKVLAVLGVAGAALAGCATNNNGNTEGRGGTGMMGGGSMYHLSNPTCSAPASLPGRRVTVMLADMGMSQVMAGTAPLGARMMLRADPATWRPERSAWSRRTGAGVRMSWWSYPCRPVPRSVNRLREPTGRSMRRAAWVRHPSVAAPAPATGSRRARSVGPA
jgi:hypothetical protein